MNYSKIKIEKNCSYDIHVLRQPKKINQYKPYLNFKKSIFNRV